MKSALTTCVILCLQIGLWGQAVLIGEADRYKLGKGEEVRLSFTFRGNGEKFEAPDFGADWMVLAGPNRSFQTSIINGRMSQEQRFDFLVRPRKTGALRIGPARIRHEGKWIESKPLQFEVVDGVTKPRDPNDPRARAAQNSFMRLKMSKRSVYVGQPVTLDYVLYYTNAEMPSEQEKPSFKGFYTQELEVADEARRGREVVDGRTYRTYLWKRILLIPQLSSAAIDGQPLVVIPTYVRGRRRDIFGRIQQELVRQRVLLDMPPLTVKPLPEKGKPASFSGAVGSFRFSAALSDTAVEADGSTALRMELSGTGNLGLCALPEPVFPKEVEVFDPEEREQIRLDRQGQRGSRSREYLIIPRYRGTYKIPPVRFSYFDPKKERYVEISEGAFPIEVIGGAVAPVSGSSLGTGVAGAGKQQVAPIEEDIRFIDTRTADWRKRDAPPPFHWWYWLAILPLVLALGGQLYALKRSREVRFEADIRASKAYRKAARELKKSSGDVEVKSELLQHILEDYLMSRLKMQRSDLDERHIDAVLQKKGVTAETRSALLERYQTILGLRFAPAAESAEELHNSLLNVLKQLEKSLGT